MTTYGGMTREEFGRKVEADIAERMTERAAHLADPTKCHFELVWIGLCENPAKDGFCEEHAGVKCISCGRQATHQCSYGSSLTCGHPLCKDCDGFDLPAGGHVHRRITAADDRKPRQID